MSENHDQSHLDRKYFIDREKYNCPYCNRRSITYSVESYFSFDWSQDRTVHGYLVVCGGTSCKKTSLHLSNYYIDPSYDKFWKLPSSDKLPGECFDEKGEVIIDSLFFYHSE